MRLGTEQERSEVSVLNHLDLEEALGLHGTCKFDSEHVLAYTRLAALVEAFSRVVQAEAKVLQHIKVQDGSRVCGGTATRRAEDFLIVRVADRIGCRLAHSEENSAASFTLEFRDTALIEYSQRGIEHIRTHAVEYCRVVLRKH